MAIGHDCPLRLKERRTAASQRGRRLAGEPEWPEPATCRLFGECRDWLGHFKRALQRDPRLGSRAGSGSLRQW